MSVAAFDFEKWEGLGNDFVVASGLSTDVEQARRLCDRHLGIGADGVLVVGPADDPTSVARMTVLNADGSRPEMCGNGLRCVAAWLVGEGRAPLDTWFSVATDAGLRRCRVTRGGAAHASTVAVEMGIARFASDLEVDLGGEALRFHQVDMGNPHAICFDRFGQEALSRVGGHVSRLPAEGTNVSLVRGEGERLEVMVWERGVGPTQACGTGACAVAAAACRAGRAPLDRAIEVLLPGGALTIVVRAAPGDASDAANGDAADSAASSHVASGSAITYAVEMTGPARRVFRGRWADDAGAAPGNEG